MWLCSLKFLQAKIEACDLESFLLLLKWMLKVVREREREREIERGKRER